MVALKCIVKAGKTERDLINLRQVSNGDRLEMIRGLCRFSCASATHSDGNWRCVDSQEIAILRKLSHPNCIRMLDWFETAEDICVVTEYAQGELFEVRVARRMQQTIYIADVLVHSIDHTEVIST